MSDIKVRRNHSLPLEDARKAAEKVAARLQKDFDLDYAWKRHVLHFERTGVHGELHVTDHDVRLEANLSFLLAFLKPRIEREIDEQFDKYFAAPAAKKPVAKKPAPTKKRT
ncbi:MAG TPA: polyhydroxyalkanoic acid system family protein [Burkholderiales bacterium]|nr:polyhydroxyalkanoic acid system family protein [Burkholderiales bacterium]